MDVLKVGTSLGAGGIGYLHNDSIFRVGDNGSGSYELLFEGPLRSRFALHFNNWKIEDTPLEVTHEIEIAAGKHCYQSFVAYNGPGMLLDLVAGIVNMKSDTVYMLNLNDHFSGLLTHDLQAEDTSLLAMALVVPTEYLKSTGVSKESGEGITQTYYTVLNARPEQPVPYRFYALWEREDPRWNSVEEVISFLRSEADRWAYSLIVQPVP
jgi:hypothetical protein